MNFAAVHSELYATAFALAFFAITTAIEDRIRVERWPGLARAGYKLLLLVATVAFFFAPARILVILSVPLGLTIYAGLAAAFAWCLLTLPALQLVQNATRRALGRPAKPIRWLPEPARLRPAPEEPAGS
jgi:hypothetical protein